MPHGRNKIQLETRTRSEHAATRPRNDAFLSSIIPLRQLASIHHVPHCFEASFMADHPQISSPFSSSPRSRTSQSPRLSTMASDLSVHVLKHPASESHLYLDNDPVSEMWPGRRLHLQSTATPHPQEYHRQASSQFCARSSASCEVVRAAKPGDPTTLALHHSSSPAGPRDEALQTASCMPPTPSLLHAVLTASLLSEIALSCFSEFFFAVDGYLDAGDSAARKFTASICLSLTDHLLLARAAEVTGSV